MRWKEVDYLCNGLTARIRFTTAEEPEVIIEEKGVIKCAGWGYMPKFYPNRGGYIRNPGQNTLVILEGA